MSIAKKIRSLVADTPDPAEPGQPGADPTFAELEAEASAAGIAVDAAYAELGDAALDAASGTPDALKREAAASVAYSRAVEARSKATAAIAAARERQAAQEAAVAAAKRRALDDAVRAALKRQTGAYEALDTAIDVMVAKAREAHQATQDAMAIINHGNDFRSSDFMTTIASAGAHLGAIVTYKLRFWPGVRPTHPFLDEARANLARLMDGMAQRVGLPK